MKKFFLLLLFYPMPILANGSCTNFFEGQSSKKYIADQNCLWNETHTAAAVCANETLKKCFIADSKNVTDVSNIQSSNLGKLGVTKKSEYSSVSTKPKEWVSSKENTHVVTFQTRAWLKGQRYTVSGPAAAVNGKYRGK